MSMFFPLKKGGESVQAEVWMGLPPQTIFPFGAPFFLFGPAVTQTQNQKVNSCRV